MVKELLFLPLYVKFMKDTASGRRRKLNGERIKPQTVANYDSVLKLLVEYEAFCGAPLRIKTNIRNNVRVLLQERNYWRKFYRKFSDFLHYEKGYFDNFTGFAFKNIKSAFRYLKNEKCLVMQEFYESFYVREEISALLLCCLSNLFSLYKIKNLRGDFQRGCVCRKTCLFLDVQRHFDIRT